MSNADELHNKIMSVIMESFKDNSCTYADVFGALSVSRAFFEIEYSIKMGAAWRKTLEKASDEC